MAGLNLTKTHYITNLKMRVLRDAQAGEKSEQYLTMSEKKAAEAAKAAKRTASGAAQTAQDAAQGTAQSAQNVASGTARKAQATAGSASQVCPCLCNGRACACVLSALAR